MKNKSHAIYKLREFKGWMPVVYLSQTHAALISAHIQTAKLVSSKLPTIHSLSQSAKKYNSASK